MRKLTYGMSLLFATAVAGSLAAGCVADIGDPDDPNGNTSGGTGNAPSTGTGGPSGGTGGDGPSGSTTTSTGVGGGPVDECVPGIPATSQIPRILNREYDAVVRDLLGVTTLKGAGNGAPSSLLVPDFEGSMTDLAWNSYRVAAETIAAEVMAGPNKDNFMNCDPAEAGCFESTIRTFGRKAFRRPLTDAEVQRFMKLTTIEPKGTPAEIAEAILYAFLASPSFIMRPELANTTEGNAFKLSDHEVATRLAFLIWGSVPDDVLNSKADAGELHTNDQILEQARRMVGDRPRTAPVVRAFHRVYADIRQGSHWATMNHDPQKFPEYTADVVEPMMAEIEAFFEEVAFEGGSFSDIFLSNVAFVNKATAPLYGLDPAKYGTELTRETLDANDRPGFLTRVGFLSSYSSFDTTSPILRGAFVTTKLLGAALTPVPGVETTPVPPGEWKTWREATDARTGKAGCVECHKAFVNPPGYVLERYDSVGKVASVDSIGGPIDGTADVYFGENNIKTISSPLQLMTELGAGPVARRRYAEQWVAFATRRTPNSNDACVVNDLNAKLSDENYTILNLLADLTQADSFRLRVVEN